MHRVMISIHVPKTGGTSFRKILEEFFGDGFQSDYNWEPRPTFMDCRVIELSDEELRGAFSDIHCVHGHFNARKYLRLRDVAGIEPVFVTWIRHPVERAISTYQFLRTLQTPIDKQPEWEKKAKAMTLEQFYAETNFGSNRQFAQLRAIPPDEFSFFGCMERYGEAIKIFEKMFFPRKDLKEIPHELKNKERSGKTYDIPRNVRDLLTKANEQDYLLYRYARGWVSGALNILEKHDDFTVSTSAEHSR